MFQAWLMRVAVWGPVFAAVSFGLSVTHSLTNPLAPKPCSSEEQCYNTTDWRCVEAPPGVHGATCTLDYGYNTTSFCVCSNKGPKAVCANGTYPKPNRSNKQYLIIGDSVSMGYTHTLTMNLSASGWDTYHAPGNCDNTNWGRGCLKGWLGSDPNRWDLISMNWGLHDLAYPDNEHLDVDTYAMLLADILHKVSSLAPRATAMWVTTTPVPTNPPPDPVTGKSCVLIPGRLESDVLRYNAAAAKVMASAKVNNICDTHSLITDYCGVGYRSCNITQCAGPHFSSEGFAMLGNHVAGCARAALKPVWDRT